MTSNNKAAAEQLAQIVDESPDAFIRVSTDPIIESWSKGDGRMLGYSEKDAAGMSVRQSIWGCTPGRL